MTRILVADDSSYARRVLRNLVEQDADWEVCAEAIDGGDAVQRAMETNPDLIVLDFQMPVMNGLEAAREIAKVAPDVPILLCTAHLSHGLVGEAQRVGIHGAVSKSNATDIMNGIRALLRHEPFFFPAGLNQDQANCVGPSRTREYFDREGEVNIGVMPVSDAIRLPRPTRNA